MYMEVSGWACTYAFIIHVYVHVYVHVHVYRPTNKCCTIKASIAQ